jgi:hypothetical protein
VLEEYTHMGSIAMLRDNFIKAKKNAKTFGYWKENYRSREEVEPLTEVFIDILSNKNKLMLHLHK